METNLASALTPGQGNSNNGHGSDNRDVSVNDGIKITKEGEMKDEDYDNSPILKLLIEIFIFLAHYDSSFAKMVLDSFDKGDQSSFLNAYELKLIDIGEHLEFSQEMEDLFSELQVTCQSGMRAKQKRGDSLKYVLRELDIAYFRKEVWNILMRKSKSVGLN